MSLLADWVGPEPGAGARPGEQAGAGATQLSVPLQLSYLLPSFISHKANPSDGALGKQEAPEVVCKEPEY